MFGDFEEWFAIRNQHKDDEIWPGKLSFSETEGITLEAICFRDHLYESPNCETGTITGYLDYQRPTTIVNPWVQSQGGGSIGVDTPVMRAKSRIMAAAVLKNIHLEDISEKCFTALHMNMPAFSAWYAPQLVKTDFEVVEEKAPPKVSIDIDRSSCEYFTLYNKINVKIQSYAGTSEDEYTTKITQRTSLIFEFPDPIDFSDAQQWIWKVNTMFSFLLGHRMAQNPYGLKTTHTRKWNGRDENITAELVFRPVFKSTTHYVSWYDALFMRQNCVLTPEELLNATFEQSDALFYLMNMVLLMERPEKLSANDFGELLGCVEDFDIKAFGNGSSRALRSARESLKKVIKQHGTDDDLQTLHDLISKSPNRLTLAERLDRLQKMWEGYGFGGGPKSVEITKIRNSISHGRGVDLSSDDYKKISRFGNYLCALSRFHIFRMLGIPGQDIGSAFQRVWNVYGKYAPENKGNL
ncbi:hypothetical protein [Pseudodonghicola sp.]|jgi:hypothetical protein|uniref:ApeA N-terminal domain 1-containing protein n=1 Tax=Pseudodonghicola sp. TaxID=1969463 RepID=UPI003A97E3DF